MTTKPKAKKFRIRRTPAMGAGTPPPSAAPTTDEAPQPRKSDRPVSAATLTRPVDAPKQAQPSQAQAVQARAAQMQAAQAQAAAAAAQAAQAAQAQAQATEAAAQTHAAPAEIASPRETRAETDIDAIRREGLTGRQLRMARRVAQKHGLAPISDFDAVRQLRVRGIDPFQRSNMLELVVPADGAGGGAGGKEPPAMPVDNGGNPPDMGGGKVQLPQTVQLGKVGVPSTDTMSPADRRAIEIGAIQKDIAKRRRRKLALLFTRLSAFVFIPTILAGWYYFVMATPMYATKTEFMILTADGAATGGRGLLPSAMYNSQDSIAVQSYLLSKDAMLRLDAEYGFKAHFADPGIDPIQRLAADASNESAHKLYKKSVKIGYDPTEGVVRMEVIAANPQTSFQFSELLVRFAEERVDDLSRQKRDDSMRLANRKLEEAKVDRRAKQEALIRLQETQGVDPAEQLGVLRQQIANYEAELLEKELQLAALLDNPRPNRAKVDGARGDVRRLAALLETLNARMTAETNGQDSLAARAAKIQMAQADLQSADMFLQSALESAKSAETEASKQVRYLTVPVKPIQAESPSYPRAFENTILAFLIFAGVYLMISLTASILREQVSS
ncbi:capsule biosynthesis protein [Alisedimentitalea sp. MJ-SS2]|uniref:capsule biosynthesis protein n=1 Tax=Aliisedimentitalea sp. MJ-SS2 TaxID=3049795 RepID=UPI0029103F70|nr:capsule biosynthesis protein [Alisedimentitalea sp. MJ-SS2]MDU8928828.1 capsule biosynthesis protein [Alisedimentitalea sp. MJ-SS2]